MKISIRKDIHIEILKYTRENVEFTICQLIKDLKFNQNEKDLFVQGLLYDRSLIITTGRSIETWAGIENIHCISAEGIFKLLEYEQLQEARQSSKEAKWFAIAAILLSAITGFIQIYISVYANK